MEIAHQRECLRDAHASGDVRKEKYQTVNLDQFRNNEVGYGYQARGVVRQRIGGTDSAMKIVDMSKKQTKSDSSDDDDMMRDKRERRKLRKSSVEDKEVSSSDKYLQCKALRDFRKEIEKILSEGKLR